MTVGWGNVCETNVDRILRPRQRKETIVRMVSATVLAAGDSVAAFKDVC